LAARGSSTKAVDATCVKRFAYRTEQCYVRSAEQFIHFPKGADGWRHPKDLGAPEVEAFLSHRALDKHVSA
jgi:hypothetical protein